MALAEKFDTPTIPSVEDLVARAEAMVPFLKERAAETETLRMLPQQNIDQLFDGGFLRIFQPKRYGGYEMEWRAQTLAGSVIAHGCSSTSWISCVVGSHSAYVARMAPEAQDDVWGNNSDVLISTGSVPRGVTIRKVDGGVEISGRWSFLSGVDHAAWVLTRGCPDGEEDGPQYYYLYPRSDFEIEDDWFVSGMRGTGSKTVVLNKVFVPNHRMITLPDLVSPDPPGSVVNTGYVYRYNFRAFAGTALLGPIMGTAEAAFDLFLNGLKDGSFRNMDPEDVSVQILLAEAEAEIRTARILLQNQIKQQQSYASLDKPFSMTERISLIRDRTFAARMMLNAVDRLTSSLTSEQIFEEHPLQRHHRDMCAMVQQIGINWDRNMSNCAKKLLGLPTEIPYLNTY